MYSLILDSANKDLVVSLAKDNEIIEEINYEAWQRQSELMIPEIEKILKKNKVDPKEINEILVTKGPGSYTGVRIALTIAKVYAYLLNIPVYAFSSLKALEDPDNTSICLINARSSRSYVAIYSKNKCLLEDQIMTNQQVIELIKNHETYSVCGDIGYLNADFRINHKETDLSKNLLALKNDDDLVKNILSLKAVYLKD